MVCFDNGHPILRDSLQQLTHRLQVYSRDVPPKQDIYKGLGYRIYSAYSTAKARAVKIKLYEGSFAKDVGKRS